MIVGTQEAMIMVFASILGFLVSLDPKEVLMMSGKAITPSISVCLRCHLRNCQLGLLLSWPVGLHVKSLTSTSPDKRVVL